MKSKSTLIILISMLIVSFCVPDFAMTVSPSPSSALTETLTVNPFVTEAVNTVASTSQNMEVFRVDDFSEDYYGIIRVEASNQSVQSGEIAIYDKKSDQELIRVPSAGLYLYFHDGKLKANIFEYPYGEQSQIMYDDFNFDGAKDFAIQDGIKSCYGLPSFRIYLSQDGGFVLNKDFTRLAQEYCGMFMIDKDQQKIFVMNKSGCCWHQFSEFIIENGVPTVKRITTDDVNNWIPPYRVLAIQEWENGKKIERTEKYLRWDEVKDHIILSFDLLNNGGKVILFNLKVETGSLNYALVTEDGLIAFDFPSENMANPVFVYSKERTKVMLRFTDNGAEYEIYEDLEGNSIKQVGIKIKTDEKTTVLEGDTATIQGNLLNIEQAQWDNVTVNK